MSVVRACLGASLGVGLTTHWSGLSALADIESACLKFWGADKTVC